MADIKANLEALLMEDPVIKQAIERTKKNDALVTSSVTKILNSIMSRVENKEDDFELKHGFMTLGKTVNYLGQALCKDYDSFVEELSKAHNLVVNNVMESLGPKKPCAKCEGCENQESCFAQQPDMENFSLRRLMLLAGSIIDYVYWREALGDYIQQAEEHKDDAAAVVLQSPEAK